MTDKEKKELNDGVISIFKRFNILDHRATIGGLRDDILKLIDSMQLEEIPPKFPLISQKKCMYTKDDYTDEDRKILCDGCEEECEFNKEEPVSDKLEEAAASKYCEGSSFEDAVMERLAFKAGAQWQEKKDQETIELAEDHAMLAGMEKMKEQMMAKSIEAVVSQVPCSNEIILYNPSSVDKYYLPQEMNKLGLNKGDKVKLVIIKEEKL